MGLPASVPTNPLECDQVFLSSCSLSLTELCLICLSHFSCEIAWQGLPQVWEAVCHVVNVILEISQQVFLLHHKIAGLCNWVA